MQDTRRQSPGGALKSWVMVVLTFLFVLLYAAALMGWLTQLENERMASRLEPIILLIIGYYFGRLPGQHNESSLKDEIARLTQKADAAQHAKEQAQQARESLEEKVKNARQALTLPPFGSGARPVADHSDRSGVAAKEETQRQSVTAALNILSS